MASNPRAPWPSGLTCVPPISEASLFAAEVRAAVLPADRISDTLPNFRRISRAGRFEVSQEILSGAAGQQEALLVPLDNDRFGICVDPTPRGGWSRVSPTLRVEVRRHRFRFRVAHEIAHTFFYDRTSTRPRRLLPGSAEEEAFCDEFARSLLLPREIAAQERPSADSVMALHCRYDVSVELAARAVASAHRGAHVALWYHVPRDGWLIQWTNVSAHQVAVMRATAQVYSGRGQALSVGR